ncbi:zf-HC2 domain-containing protein [Shimazuella sp. AN120528]|uniref:anti-sigma factor family protein n=1 Tax=Shimazuella soli TaxID=1892854 RepID=UPI001F0EF1F6|nr:zf-HC2 domain-containing protein [Shimazuella soli]MCH5586087.1 zf-HC2 domain-containing protein [Shimazuella soli]
MQHVDHLLSAYVDNELKEQERLVVEKHLQDCTDCLELYGDFTWMNGQLKNTFESLLLPKNITSKVMQGIHSHEEQTYREVPVIFSYTALRWSTISSILLLLVIHISLFFLLGSLFSFTPIRILYHLVHGFHTVFSAIPYLSLTVAIFCFPLIGASLWSLRLLLSSKKVEMQQ